MSVISDATQLAPSLAFQLAGPANQQGGRHTGATNSYRAVMISAVAWLPRGVAKPVPELAQPSGAAACRLRARRLRTLRDARPANTQRKNS